MIENSAVQKITITIISGGLVTTVLLLPEMEIANCYFNNDCSKIFHIETMLSGVSGTASPSPAPIE